MLSEYKLPTDPGIANLAVLELFEQSQQQGATIQTESGEMVCVGTSISVSFIEIYNEQVKDLLSTQFQDGVTSPSL